VGSLPPLDHGAKFNQERPSYRAVREFVDRHYPHFNAAVVRDAASAYERHLAAALRAGLGGLDARQHVRGVVHLGRHRERAHRALRHRTGI
jgi:hypothetical protein